MPRDKHFDRLAPLLGHILVEHGNLEGDAGRMLARLDGKMDEHSDALYASKKSFNDKIDKIRKGANSKVTDPVMLAEIIQLTDKMDDVNKRRNKFIHSEYFAETDDRGHVFGFLHREIKQMGDLIDTTDPKSGSTIYSVNLSELEKLIEDMIALGLDLRAAAETYGDTLPYTLPPL